MRTIRQSPRAPVKPLDMDAPYFSVREVAWLLRCSFTTVRRMLEDGRLAYSQREKGGTILVSREDLDAYHRAHRVSPTVRRTRRAPAKSAA